MKNHSKLLLAAAFILIAIMVIGADYNTALATLAINTNVASLEAQKNLEKAQRALQESFNRLSSGLRQNTASDDAEGLGAQEDSAARELASLRQFMDSVSYLAEVLKTTSAVESQLQTVLARITDLGSAANGSSQKNARAAVEKSIAQLNNLDKKLSLAYSLAKNPGFVPEIYDIPDLIATQRQIINTVVKSTSNFSRLAPKKATAEKTNVFSLLNKQINLYRATNQDLINFADEVRGFADDEVDYAKNL